MHKYELMVILDPSIEERTIAPSLDKFLNVIRNAEGTVDNVDIWGRRRLAYEIKKNTEGYYAVVNMNCTSAAIVELDRQLKLSEAVLRTKVLRADEAVVNIKPFAVPEVSAEEAAAEKPAAKKAAPKTKKAE
jgi:small subunit ribosomal protein S6